MLKFHIFTMVTLPRAEISFLFNFKKYAFVFSLKLLHIVIENRIESTSKKFGKKILQFLLSKIVRNSKRYRMIVKPNFLNTLI